MRISDWSSDVCSSDLARLRSLLRQIGQLDLAIPGEHPLSDALGKLSDVYRAGTTRLARWESNPFAPAPARTIAAAGSDEARLAAYEVATAMLLKRSLRNGSVSAPHSIEHRNVGEQRSEEHTSELQSLMRNSYAVFCLEKKKQSQTHNNN